MNGINPVFKTKEIKEACYQVLLGRPSRKKDTWQPTFSDKKYISSFILNVDPDYEEAVVMIDVDSISKYLKNNNADNLLSLSNRIEESIVNHYEDLINRLLEYYDEKLSED